MHLEIDDDQRAEILAAVIDRKATIAGHVKKLTADTMPEEAALAERRLSLYATQTGAGGRVGLVAMFGLAPDLDEERVKAGETRDPDGQQDIFGGGVATGGGHPAGAIEYLGAFGKRYPTQVEADASFRRGPDGPDDEPETARDPEAPAFKALPSGEPAEDAQEVTIDPDAPPEPTADDVIAASDALDRGRVVAWDEGPEAHRVAGVLDALAPEQDADEHNGQAARAEAAGDL
jgi:hypothetical protein